MIVVEMNIDAKHQLLYMQRRLMSSPRHLHIVPKKKRNKLYNKNNINQNNNDDHISSDEQNKTREKKT